MPENITFELLGKDKHAQFKSFHNLLFKSTNVSEDWIDWWFLDAATQTRVHAAWDGDLLIGTWCVEPKRLTTDDDVINVGRCFSVGIHPDYRRRNLFVELSKHAIAEEKRLAQYEYVLGFPQIGRPVVDAHLKSGWEHVQDIVAYSFKPETLDKLTSMEGCKRIADFSGVKRLQDYTGSFVRNHRYENIRWLDNPDNHYVALFYGTSGYIVLKPYAGWCHILDVVGNSNEVRHLLNVARTLAHRHRWSELNVWNANNSWHYHDIVSCGFVEGAERASPVSLLAVKINATEPLTLSDTHFQMGGEEMY